MNTTLKTIFVAILIFTLSISFSFADEVITDTDTLSKSENVAVDNENDNESEELIRGIEKTTIKISSEVLKSGIKVSWTKSKGYKVDYFEVYRSTKKDSGFELYYTTKTGDAKSYSDKKSQKKGKAYYYKVRGVRDVDGELIYTNYSKVTYKKAPKTTKVPVESGEIIVCPDSSVVRGGQITIKTSEGNNYYVYLNSQETKDKDISVYITGGETETISVPLGEFKLYYCSGQTWYGKSEKFGSSTVGSVASSILKFNLNTAYSVTLYAVKNGNMGTKKVNMDNFPG